MHVLILRKKMNVLPNQMKCLSNVFGNLLHISRGYAVMRKIPVTWVKPEKISCIKPEKSGDGGLDFKINPDDYICKLEKSKEIDSADDIVKKMFTVDFNRRKELIRVQRQKAIELVHRHSHDQGSMESKIASTTVEILQLQEHQEKFPNNKKTKVFLKELIEKRKKWLKKLRLQDYRRFEFLLERLNLVYHPFPEENPRLMRKTCTKQLLNKYCDELKKKKLDEYRKELEAQQKGFFEDKVKKLEFIRNEEIACGVTPTVTEAEIEAAKQKAASFR